MYNKFYLVEMNDKTGRWHTYKKSTYTNYDSAEVKALELNDSGNYVHVRIIRTVQDIMFEINHETGKKYRKSEKQNESI